MRTSERVAMARDSTLNKLIILYILRKVSFPLSNTQIIDLITEHGYTDYFHVQEAINDLLEAKLISVEQIRHTSQYSATMDGEKTLEYFSSDIPYVVKKEIDAYLRENSFELRSVNCMTADYEMTEDGGYSVHCRIKEGRETLVDLTISVTTEEEAEHVCTSWSSKAQDLYMTIMTALL